MLKNDATASNGLDRQLPLATVRIDRQLFTELVSESLLRTLASMFFFVLMESGGAVPTIHFTIRTHPFVVPGLKHQDIPEVILPVPMTGEVLSAISRGSVRGPG